MVKRHSKF